MVGPDCEHETERIYFAYVGIEIMTDDCKGSHDWDWLHDVMPRCVYLYPDFNHLTCMGWILEEEKDHEK